MNKLYAKMAAGAASVLLLGGLLTTSVLAGDLEITDNGNGSNNSITVTNISTCVVGQQNTTTVSALVSAKASTGGNRISGNTGGGDLTIDTGDADATSTLIVTGGNNTATNPCCCSECAVPPSGDRKIKDNGNNSTNDIVVTDSKTSTIGQTGATGVAAKVKTKAKTGKNKIKNNTGGGALEVKTGNSTSDSTLDVTGGSNTLNP